MAVENKKKENKIKWYHRMGIGKETEFFIENLGQLLFSGMGLVSALKIIKKEIRSEGMLLIIDNILHDIDTGHALWQSLERTGAFPESVTSLIRIGEESGRLAENFEVVTKQQQKLRLFRSKLRSAMMYPTLVFFVTFIVGLGIAWFILPKLTSVFSSLKVELPLVTRWLLVFGEFMKEWGNIFVPCIILFFCILVYFIFFFKPTKFIGQKLIFITPVAGRLVRQIEIARFGHVLGQLLEAGLPIIKAIESVERSSSLLEYKKFYRRLKSDVEEGRMLADSFKNNPLTDKLMPPSTQQLIATGESSGFLSKVLKNIGDSFESKIDLTTKNLNILLEPILLVIVWLGVVTIALAIILPIYSLVGGLNQQTSNRSNTSSPQAVESEDVQNQEEEEFFYYVTISNENIESLEIRTLPEEDADVIGKIVAGEFYKNTGERNGWYEIRYEKDGKEIVGWVEGKEVNLVKEEEIKNDKDDEENVQKINQ